MKEVMSNSENTEKAPATEKPEVFNPIKELKKLKKLPREEKREKLTEFKKELMTQKEGIASMQEALIAAIRKNPNISKSELYKKIETLGGEAKMTTAQKSLAKLIAAAYTEKHDAVEKEWGRYKDAGTVGELLYAAFFDQDPYGKVEVVKGPMTFYFKCHNPKDYARIYNLTFKDHRDPTPEEVRQGNLTGGCSIESAPTKALQFTVIAENSKNVPDQEQSEETMLHEEQHAMKRFFADTHAKKTITETLNQVPENLNPVELLNAFEIRIERAFEIMRFPHEDEAKDEILASLKPEGVNPQDLLTSMTKTKDKDGLYDYLYELRKNEVPRMIDMIKKTGWAKEIPDSAMRITKIARKVFETDYHQMLKDAITTFESIRPFFGFSKEKTIALLINEPLDKWEKVLERLYEAKKAK